VNVSVRVGEHMEPSEDRTAHSGHERTPVGIPGPNTFARSGIYDRNNRLPGRDAERGSASASGNVLKMMGLWRVSAAHFRAVNTSHFAFGLRLGLIIQSG